MDADEKRGKMAYGEDDKEQEQRNKEARAKLATMSERDLLARLLWGEARGEIWQGQQAVANVVMNRLTDGRYGGTLHEVCLRPWQFSCFNSNDPNLPLLVSPPMREPFTMLLRIAEQAIQGALHDLTDGATHYFNPAVVPGQWPKAWRRDRMAFKARIGRHDFYFELRG